MFRPMRRPKNAIPDEQAKKLLREEKRGVIAMNGDDGYPFAIPCLLYTSSCRLFSSEKAPFVSLARRAAAVV